MEQFGDRARGACPWQASSREAQPRRGGYRGAGFIRGSAGLPLARELDDERSARPGRTGNIKKPGWHPVFAALQQPMMTSPGALEGAHIVQPTVSDGPCLVTIGNIAGAIRDILPQCSVAGLERHMAVSR